MAGTRYPERVRLEVLRLGKSGKTYEQIRERFPIPKSTLSFWFKNAGRKPDRARQLAHLKVARAAAFVTIQRKKEERLADASLRAAQVVATVDLNNISTLKALLAMLYWAEGTKADNGSLIFTNTDPLLASFYISILRSAYPIDEAKLRIRLHLHHYHKHRDARAFWSKLLNVPESQFGKIHVKKRSVLKKFRKNFQGICFIVYHDSSVRRELLALGRLLAEKTALPSFNG